MRVLIADDDTTSRKVIESLLTKWGYEVILACDGHQAWEILQSDDVPRLIILDWMMPGPNGAEICRRFRKRPGSEMAWLILLTARGRKKDIVEGLEAGANDYMIKPFNHEELRIRIQNSARIVKLQTALATRVKELERAMAHIRTLQGILPICSYCKKIRNDENYWQQLEAYFSTYTDVRFSHGICPDCYEKYVRPEIEEIEA